MTFDDTVPTQGQRRGLLRRLSPPENEVPVVVPVRHVLARSPGVALSLLGARVFTTGVLLELDVRLQRRPNPRQAAGLHELSRPLTGEGIGPADRLLLRVAFPDGRVVEPEGLSSPGFWSSDREARYSDPDEPVLRPIPTGQQPGPGQSVGLWLGPLPPEGPLVFTCSWPSLGVGISSVVLDGGELARAGRAAEILWPVIEEQTPEQLAIRMTGGYLPLHPPG